MMKLVLKNVRLSFPSLYKTEEYGGQDTGKFGATFLIDKKDPQAKEIKAIIKKVAEEEFGSPLPKGITNCLKDGDEKEYEGYAGNFSIKGTTKRRPILVDEHKTPIAEEDGRLYPGCFVNASLSVWAMNNSFGKKVLAALNGIQFAGPGDAFGAVNDALDDFDDIQPAEAAEGESDPFA
jgi:hypothetical protein